MSCDNSCTLGMCLLVWQEAEGWLLCCRKDCRGRKAIRKSKTRDVFAWTNKGVTLLLKVRHKAVMAKENID